MFQKLVLSLGIALGVCANSALAKTPDIYMGASNSVEFVLNPNESQKLTNAFPFVLNAACIMTCDDEQTNTIEFKVLNKTGMLNGTSVNTGELMTLDIHPKDQIVISAPTGSKVELKNIGTTTIHADCNFIY